MIRQAPATRIRCAIYTRKSTEENLALEFNSLDAQRESAEAYIASQKAEGWVCLPDRYDDGGFTGGNMERPALKRLLDDIEAGKVDCVVVYKVDRLSRSLLDFARILEQFEKRRVSFVAVTQQINSASSMGRLMLNVLLSFAQFEREIISERTRDKIAASRRKGKWSGGHPLLGYDVLPGVGGSKIMVNDDEAKRVRDIFDLYLDHQSLLQTAEELNRRGWTTKRWTTKGGSERGGRPFDKNNLHQLLRNIVYVGKIRYKDEVHEGEHEAIVPPERFEKAQSLLRRNARSGGAGGALVRNKYGALLKGLLRCGPCGCAMTHTYSSKKGRIAYRYYVCSKADKRGRKNCSGPSLPAEQVEQFVVERIRSIGTDPALLRMTLDEASRQGREEMQRQQGEQATIERELTYCYAEIAKVASEANGSHGAAARLADLQERIRIAEARSIEVRDRIAALGRDLVDERDAVAALNAFDPVWNELAPREQIRLMRLLLLRVEYDGAAGNISITFHPGGFAALAEQAGLTASGAAA